MINSNQVQRKGQEGENKSATSDVPSSISKQNENRISTNLQNNIVTTSDDTIDKGKKAKIHENRSEREELKAKLREEVRRKHKPDEMRAWQKQWRQWTAYLNSQGVPIIREHNRSKNEQIQTSDECIGMNESGGKIMTQTKMETPERSNCELKSDDRAREVTESRMSAEAVIFGKNKEWTRMDNVNTAIHERRVDDKAITVVSQESEGQREQGQTEQFLGSLWAEILPESRVC